VRFPYVDLSLSTLLGGRSNGEKACGQYGGDPAAPIFCFHNASCVLTTHFHFVVGSSFMLSVEPGETRKLKMPFFVR
jgi:hypothetical protein